MKTSEGKEDVDIRGRNGFSQKTSIIIFALLSISLLVTAILSVTFIILYATRDSSSTVAEIASSNLSDVCQSAARLELAGGFKHTFYKGALFTNKF